MKLKRDFAHLKYLADVEAVTSIFQKYKNKETPEMECLRDAFFNLFFYVNTMEMERKGFDHVVDNLLKEKNNLKSENEKIKKDLLLEKEKNEFHL
jgi:glutamate/tyrosine decarboxylase-like PLP-dependent enzyme